MRLTLLDSWVSARLLFGVVVGRCGMPGGYDNCCSALILSCYGSPMRPEEGMPFGIRIWIGLYVELPLTLRRHLH